ncbi:MAG: hypothetical protein M0R17_10750 [Candidatus Omnitrophica bacterium]|jgi:hypothetical protein|nr:hypothetical protein [Candidatus Omnitrophota bacterium]MDD5252626.1 hypothetical protein [Candidatus Omnitrophota bacterium]
MDVKNKGNFILLGHIQSGKATIAEKLPQRKAAPIINQYQSTKKHEEVSH